MGKYRQVGGIYKKEPENNWIGIVIGVFVILMLVGMCSGGGS